MEADMLIADRACDADARAYLSRWRPLVRPRSSRHGQPVLAPRDYDRELYAARHLIENFFAKIKQFRAIATRYEKTARNFPAAVQLVASIVSARNDETVQAPVCKLLAQLCKAINEISGHPLPLPRSHASFSELVKRPCDRRMSGKL
jgi:transposase